LRDAFDPLGGALLEFSAHLASFERGLHRLTKDVREEGASAQPPLRYPPPGRAAPEAGRSRTGIPGMRPPNEAHRPVGDEDWWYRECPLAQSGGGGVVFSGEVTDMGTARIVFDRWSDRYADRISQVRSSAVRDLFAAASRPDMISLSGGMPAVGLVPLGAVAKAAHDAVLHEGTDALQYGGSDITS
jgi:hypothetical protein